MPLLRRGVVIHHSLPLGGRWRRQPPDEGKLLDADSVAIGGPGGTSNRGGHRRGKVRTAHPGLTARSRSAPLPLLSQMDPLRWAPFGSLFPLCLVVSRGGLSRRGKSKSPSLTDSFAPFWSFRKGPAGGNKRYAYAGHKLRGYFFICRLRPGAFPKPISFSLAEKETVFECQRKRGLMALLKRWQKRYGGAMLYAPNQHPSRPRPSVGETGKSFGPIFPPPGLWTMRGVGA